MGHQQFAEEKNFQSLRYTSSFSMNELLHHPSQEQMEL